MCGAGVLASVYEAIQRRGLPRITPQPTAARTVPMPGARVADLTHALTPDFPMWPGDPQFAMQTYSPLSDTTFFANTLAFHEHSGTHIDAPAHASPSGLTVDAIPADSLVAPLAVIDISARARANPDAMLTIGDILAWERAHGPLPTGALVAMNSGWSAKARDAAAFLNIDESGAMRTPGFHPDAARMLAERRAVVAIGSDTLSIDTGRSQDFGAHLAALGSGLYAVESLANLESVPAAGATVVIGAPKHLGGSGGPARVLALIPS